MTAIAARAITKTFGEHTRALDGVTFEIMQGELVALVGRSGSGKSTLLNVLGLLDRPTSGRLSVFGLEVTTLNERLLTRYRSATIGFVFQAFHLLDRRTVLENIQLGAVYTNVGKAERYRRSHDLVDQLGLRHRRDAKPSTLSGGERQRVAIARALVSQPRLLLCDEPTGNLDTANAAVVMDLLREIHVAGTTVLVVTHDPDVAAAADRRIELSDGRIAEAHTATGGSASSRLR